MATTTTTLPAAAFWRKGVEPDESRVPRKEPLRLETLNDDDEEEDLDVATLRKRVEDQEEELWLTSSDSKFYGRWSLQGASPFARKEGVVLVPGHPSLSVPGQTDPQDANSRLLLTIAAECHTQKVPTLRFDYRGVGKSFGSFDATTCVRDVVSAIRHCCGASGPFTNATVVAVSFGSAQTLGNLYTTGCHKFVSISHGLGLGSTKPDGSRRAPVVQTEDLAPLYNRTNIFFTTLRITTPKLWIVGEKDALTDGDELRTFLSHYSPGRGHLSTLLTVPGAAHDMRGHEARLARHVLNWIASSTPLAFHLDFASGNQTQSL